MTNKAYPAWLSIALCIPINVCLSAVAHAEYWDYSQTNQTAQQNVYWQQASFQRQNQYNTQVFVPPTIMPYVPFDDEQQLAIPQQLQHYQPPATQPQFQRYQPRQPQRQVWQQRQTIQRPAFPFPAAPIRQQILKAANRQLGIRYRWGGNTPRQGFDCSGFTKYAMRGTNIKIPRTAAQQSRASRTINRHQLRPGDMIFFKTKGRLVNHVGIYLGNGRFIHAASGGGKVMTDNLNKSYWQKRLHKYGTFLS